MVNPTFLDLHCFYQQHKGGKKMAKAKRKAAKKAVKRTAKKKGARKAAKKVVKKAAKRCMAKTKDGKQCKNSAKAPSKLCKTHQKKR
jgi:hypothetical protein